MWFYTSLPNFIQICPSRPNYDVISIFQNGSKGVGNLLPVWRLVTSKSIHRPNFEEIHLSVVEILLLFGKQKSGEWKTYRPLTRLKSAPTGTQKSTAWYGLGTPGMGDGIGSTGTTPGVTAACSIAVSVVVVVVVVVDSSWLVLTVAVCSTPSWGVVCAAGFIARSTGTSATGTMPSSTIPT